jgi:hypothetical protein
MAALTPEFSTDVFISYSHGDVKKTGDAPLKRWSTAFYNRLSEELSTIPEWANTALFFDDGSLDKADPLRKQLHSAVLESALFLILMSPHYLRSTECQKERKDWFQKIAAEFYPEVRSRTLIARIWPLLQTDFWPPELCYEGQPPLSFWFHEQPGDPVTTRPFGWTTATEAKSGAALVDLAGAIVSRLAELKQAIERKRKSALNIEKLSASSGQAIYVHARRGEESRWAAICNDLLSAGYGVVPDEPEPVDVSQMENESLRTLMACDGLLLVPGDRPTHLASDLVVVGHRRRNSARAASNKPLPCAVLDVGHLSRARPLLQSSAKNLQIDWIEASTSDWTNGVRNWLNRAAGLAGGAL